MSKVCRNHGGCDWCLENRQHKFDKKKQAMDFREKEMTDGEEVSD